MAKLAPPRCRALFRGDYSPGADES